MLEFFLRSIGVLIAAILAIVCGWAFQQIAGVVDPSLHYFQRNCIGAAIFALVMFGLLFIFGNERREN
jgi:hypothetical protein